MSVDIVVRSGDTRPNLQRTLYDSGGVPINLTGYTITLNLIEPASGILVISEPCNIVGLPENGVVEFAWENTNAPTDGFFFAQYILGDGNDTIHIPNASPLTVLFTNDTSHEYSYSGNPSLRTIDRTRFLVQDTDISKALLSDAEITFINSEWTSPYVAAAEAATVIGTRYSGYSDKTVGPLRVRYTDLAQRYFDLAKNLKLRGNLNTGALAILTQVDFEDDGVTKRGPIFKRGMHDTHGNTMPLLGSQQ